jgi:hypothetical protein
MKMEKARITLCQTGFASASNPGRALELEGRCFRRRQLYGGHVQRPGSRKRLPSKDFDADDDQIKILAKNQDSQLLSVLRSDGQLPAALRAALSSRLQRNHRGVCAAPRFFVGTG